MIVLSIIMNGEKTTFCHVEINPHFAKSQHSLAIENYWLQKDATFDAIEAGGSPTELILHQTIAAFRLGFWDKVRADQKYEEIISRYQARQHSL
jgi:hypothetical protein